MSDDTERRRFAKGDFYRLCREWHGYFSALAFLALIFFAGTGILLNHPGLLQGEPPAAEESNFRLSAEEIARVKAAGEPGAALAQIAAGRTQLAGVYRSGELAGADVFVNLQGVRGRSDVVANLETGEVTTHVERKGAVRVMNELHRGEHAGDTWRFLIDVIAGLLIGMSLIGLVLFFSLRFRMKTAMMLMGASAVIMIGLFIYAAT